MLGPIFQREFLTLPRRAQHYGVRSVYLGMLWVLAITAWQAAVGWNETATIGDQARFSLLLFKVYALLQLTLLLFFSGLTTANSITTEKDRRTFVLLLMTDLRNYEIVLGKLFGNLLQIFLLLIGTVPVFAMLLIMGGVSVEQVVQVVVIMAGTALAAGSLGTVVALWREKTFQTLALTVLFLVLYLAAVHAVTFLPALLPEGWRGSFSPERAASWRSWLEPFSALLEVVGPDPQLSSRYLAPAYGFGLSMVAVSVLLNAVGISQLRVWNPRGERIEQREQHAEDEKRDIHAAPGRVRDVWANPILWREMATRAYGHRPLLVKAAYFLVVAVIGYYAITPVLRDGGGGVWTAVYGLVPIGVLSLLLIAAQAVTAITSEKDSRTLSLLLVTDLSPNEFIFGKLIGIAWNTKEYILPPLILAVFYAVNGNLIVPPTVANNITALVCLLLALIVLIVFTAVLGVHVALHSALSRLAIANTLGTVFFLSVGTLLTIAIILVTGTFVNQWLSFIFFLGAGIGGMWWVLSAERPSAALNLASIACPLAVFYAVLVLLTGRPGTRESADPLYPTLVIVGAFGFAVAAMLVPMLSEFDVAMGRTTGEAD